MSDLVQPPWPPVDCALIHVVLDFFRYDALPDPNYNETNDISDDSCRSVTM